MCQSGINQTLWENSLQFSRVPFPCSFLSSEPEISSCSSWFPPPAALLEMQDSKPARFVALPCLLPMESDLVSTDQPGLYKVTFQVANSAGDVSSFPAEIEILEGSVSGAPSFTLSRYIDYIPAGGSFDVYSYIETVRISGKEYSVVPGEGNFNHEDIGEDEEVVVGTDMITVNGDVDTNTPGTYKVIYSMTLDRGHNDLISGHTTLYVVVR